MIKNGIYNPAYDSAILPDCLQKIFKGFLLNLSADCTQVTITAQGQSQDAGKGLGCPFRAFKGRHYLTEVKSL